MICAPVFAVMLVSAYTCPMNVEFTPIVAELPTRQYTLHACAPFARVIVLPTEVIAVDAAWNTKTAVGSPCASKITFPEFVKVPAAAAYVPARSVRPARSGELKIVGEGTPRSNRGPCSRRNGRPEQHRPNDHR